LGRDDEFIQRMPEVSNSIETGKRVEPLEFRIVESEPSLLGRADEGVCPYAQCDYFRTVPFAKKIIEIIIASHLICRILCAAN
jgi:hypothetical protein